MDDELVVVAVVVVAVVFVAVVFERISKLFVHFPFYIYFILILNLMHW